MRCLAMRYAGLFLAVLGFAAVQPAQSDEVLDPIEAGKAFYADGDFARALSEFEFALNALRGQFSNALMATLPAAPALWTADKPSLENGVALFGAGLMVTQRYQEDKGEGRIIAEVMVDSPMVQAFSAVFSSPIMIANDPNLERIRLGETTALLKWDADRQTGDLSVSLGGRVLVKLVGHDLADKDMLVALMKSWDLAAIAHVAGL